MNEINETNVLKFFDEVGEILKANLSNYNGSVNKQSSFKEEVLVDGGIRINVLYAKNHFLAMWGNDPKFMVFAFTTNKCDKYSCEVGTYASRIFFSSPISYSSLKTSTLDVMLENIFRIGGVTSVIPFEGLPFSDDNMANGEMYKYLGSEYVGIDRELPREEIDFLSGKM